MTAHAVDLGGHALVLGFACRDGQHEHSVCWQIRQAGRLGDPSDKSTSSMSLATASTGALSSPGAETATCTMLPSTSVKLGDDYVYRECLPQHKRLSVIILASLTKPCVGTDGQHEARVGPSSHPHRIPRELSQVPQRRAAVAQAPLRHLSVPGFHVAHVHDASRQYALSPCSCTV